MASNNEIFFLIQTLNSANIVSEGRDYITLIDTKQVSVGQGSIVVEVAKYINSHPKASIEEVVNYTYKTIEQSRMCFIPNNLEYLKAGGRVSNVAFLGSIILNIHPLIEILEGKLVATKKYRGSMKKTCIKLLKEYTEMHNFDKKLIWLVYTIEFANEWKEEIDQAAKELGFETIVWVQANGVITTHGGPSAFGVAGFKR